MPAFAASIRRHGGPSQSNPEIAVLVSRTSRTPPLGAVGVDFRVDLVVGHRLDRVGPQRITQLAQVRDVRGAQPFSEDGFDDLGVLQARFREIVGEVVG
jgi:hypothetical protein